MIAMYCALSPPLVLLPSALRLRLEEGRVRVGVFSSAKSV
jgi:hypothetical protein